MKIRNTKFAKLKMIGILSLTLGIAVGSSLAQEITINKQVVGNQHGEFMLPTFDLITTGGAIDAKAVKGAPFAAEFASESVQTLADGNRIVRRSTSAYYRDTEGRTRREQAQQHFGSILMNKLREARRTTIYDPISSSTYSFDNVLRTAHRSKIFSVTVNGSEAGFSGNGKLYKSLENFRGITTADGKPIDPAIEKRWAEAVKNTLNQPRPETRQESLGARDFEGTSADGKRVTTVLPAGYMGNEKPIEIVRETWFSKELQIVVMTNTKNPLTGEQTYKITRLERAEQPRSLFEVPSDYKIVDGSKMLNQLFHRAPVNGGSPMPFYQTAPETEKYLNRLERLSN